MDIFSLSTLNDASAEKVAKAFSVKDFGRIASADIERAPFTVICGKNNSGKSYLAYLIWAYYNIEFQIIGSGKSRIKPPAWFKELIDSVPDLPDQKVVKIQKKDIQNHLNRWLGQNKNKIARSILNYEKAGLGSFKIEVTRDVYLSKNNYVPGDIFGADTNINGWSISFTEEITKVGLYKGQSWLASPYQSAEELYEILYHKVIACAVLGGSPIHRAGYIPASRSGLLLSLGFIAESLFSTLGTSKVRSSHKFSAPIADFLRSMVRPVGNASGPFDRIAELLEKNILQGSIARGENERITDFTYHPEGADGALPIYTASSMVTELTPIIETFRTNPFGALILEEPEAHLHLGAQRQMARALVRAVNQGIPVVVTTHSDTFVQQINFLIMLARNKNRARIAKELRYDNSEFLSEADVVAYEVCSESGGSSVKKLNIGEYGIAAHSLSDVILDMSHETFEVTE